ncbi:Secreted protein OS=Streptomyces fumanus OX=67302 GN=GCM10018772_13680 PE=4 SV=1 [Streptomyces fumanus]
MPELIGLEDFGRLFETFEHSAWHLETRRGYATDREDPGYAEFLSTGTAPCDLDSGVRRNVGDPGLTAEERADNVRTVIGRHGVYAKQHQLELMAPVKVVRLAISAANELAGYRDSVINGFTREDPECVEARRAYREARYRLIDAMRFSLERH